VRERGLRSRELIAGGAGPFEGPELKRRVRERGLRSRELIAGGAGPFEGPELKRRAAVGLVVASLLAGARRPAGRGLAARESGLPAR
jgi:hypothetical protein